LLLRHPSVATFILSSVSFQAPSVESGIFWSSGLHTFIQSFVDSLGPATPGAPALSHQKAIHPVEFVAVQHRYVLSILITVSSVIITRVC
jgi:hypothetical protein